MLRKITHILVALLNLVDALMLDKIVEIAIIDGNGEVLLNTLVDPEREIPLPINPRK
jgi:hypothetical protein